MLELDEYLDRARIAWGGVGLSVAAVQGGQLVYAKGFGAKELGKPGHVDADTLFQVGSTTKAFTTAALGMLVEDGKLGWDDPVIDYVPGLRLQDPWITRKLSVRDTVTHRSGAADTFYYVLGIMDAEHAIRQLQHIPVKGAFRDSFSYSNLMYALAGRVIEVVSGMDWHQFTRERLLRPLGMSRTGTSPYQFWDPQWVAPTFFGSAPGGCPSAVDARDRNVAMPHGWKANGSAAVLPWQSFDYTAAAGSLVSSAADMAKWLLLHLNGGEVEGRRLIGKQTLKQLHTVQNLHPGPFHLPCDEDREGYAMGWWRSTYRGHSHLSHGGNMIGFPSHVALLPDEKIGVVVLSNGPKWVRDDFSFHKAIVLRVFDTLLGVPRRDWAGEFLGWSQNVRTQMAAEEEQLHKSRVSEAPLSLPIERYAGLYEDRQGKSGHVEVSAQRGKLGLRFLGDGAFSADLEHWHHDVFRLRANAGVADMLDALGPQFVTFSIDAYAKVTGMSAFGAFGGSFERIAASPASDAGSKHPSDRRAHPLHAASGRQGKAVGR